MFKKLLMALGALIVIFLVGGYLFWTNLDSILKHTIEKYGSEATLADVRLDHISLSVANGEGVLKGFNVSNPKGFSSNKAIGLGSIDVKIDTNTLSGTGPIVIKQVMINDPQVTYELLNSGSSNLQVIQDNIRAYANASTAGKHDKAEAAKSEPTPPEGKAGRKIIIDSLTVNNGQVSIDQEMLNDKKLSATLPQIHLTGIGRNSSGATAAQVIQQVLGAIANEAAKVGVQELAKEKLSGALKNVPTSAIGGGAVDAVGSQLKNVFGE